MIGDGELVLFGAVVRTYGERQPNGAYAVTVDDRLHHDLLGWKMRLETSPGTGTFRVLVVPPPVVIDGEVIAR